ncbi:polysaccharide lyase family 8 protein [Tulasnella calospora MUT 4182]|uniref:Polysaccharide lyase family 8 protein n=1 Tax=Tulasnella calospora MUT 4182 TaxID=1051891 RepID=A0A0C3LFA9_9AGAM|nr:polysaccharide lyase family 8 protein [Tulasnella calospora MUT 4182]
MPSNVKRSILALSALSICSRAADDEADLQTLYNGMIPFIVQMYPVKDGAQQLAGWLKNFTATDQWPDVNYTAGCDAQKANWPAQNHWKYSLPLAAAYADVLPQSVNLTGNPPYDFAGNQTVADVLNRAMNWWYQNDFTNNDCIDWVANGTCTCGTPGMWNTNWYSNTILIPREAIQTSLLLNNFITPEQRAAAVHLVERGTTTFGRSKYGLPAITGANTLDISSNLINAGILQALAGNDTGYDLIDDAFERVHNEVQVQEAEKAEALGRMDRSGSTLGFCIPGITARTRTTNLVLSLELPAAGTQWEANDTSQSAFSKHIDGSAWSVYRNTVTNVLHWDFSVLGRFISFPVFDDQATVGLKVNYTQVLQLGQQWKDHNMVRVATSLLKNGTTVNGGKLYGNRMFYNNDYMVQRGKNYVTTVKTLSTRTGNTECVNTRKSKVVSLARHARPEPSSGTIDKLNPSCRLLENPLGFHLGQGVVFNYGSGNEYEDIAAAWDWNLIPGITTNYGETALLCNFTLWRGNRTFVGGASDGEIGVTAMDYLNPYTGAFAYRKAWFFLPDGVQHVIVSNIEDTSGSSDIFHVLDQKVNGAVYMDGKVVTEPKAGARSLWHDSMGYTFDTSESPGYENSAIESAEFATPLRSGDWKAIGTSSSPPANVTIFQAWLRHDTTQLSTPVSYSVYPGTKTAKSFASKAKKHAVYSISRTDVSAAMYAHKSVLMAVFWKRGTVQADLTPSRSVTVSTSEPAIVMVDLKSWVVTVSDPTQTLKEVDVTVRASSVRKHKCAALLHGKGKKVTIKLPQGGDLGKSAFAELC